MRRGMLIIGVLSALLLFVLPGCATLDRLHAVPVKDTTRAVIPGIPNARYWVDANLNPLIQEDLAEFEREEVEWAREGHRDPLPPANYLAISGGGNDGAFGAGLLVGWTQAGDRPTFKLVTGVSTGALIAPFAFLGPVIRTTERANTMTFM